MQIEITHFVLKSIKDLINSCRTYRVVKWISVCQYNIIGTRVRLKVAEMREER